jgi:hypothetical protein
MIAFCTHSGNRYPSQPACRGRILAVLAAALLPGWTADRAEASLIINEIGYRNNDRQQWVEFLVTTDITLGALDSIWFGDANSSTSSLQNSSRFNSTEIINNFSYFTSTSDIIKAGTLIVVGNDKVSTNFNYNPDLGNPSNFQSWNMTLSDGIGFNSTGTVVNLDDSSDVVWISSGQPVGNTDTSNFISAVAYLNANSATGGGVIADYVTAQSATNSAFQTIHKGPGGGFDGDLGNNNSLSNQSGTSINFANSESGHSRGTTNGGANTVYIQSLQAVPEPAAMIPLSLLLVAGGFFYLRRKATPAAAI